jgi:hypothetical protein
MGIPEFVTRPFADVVALLRDLVTLPREVLLVRAHRPWTGAVYVVALSVPALFDWWKPPFVLAMVVVVLAGASLSLDLFGTAVHIAWHRGRIWQGIECEACGDDGDDGDDPDAPDDVPDDPFGLSRADQEWLDSVSAGQVGTVEKSGW